MQKFSCLTCAGSGQSTFGGECSHCDGLGLVGPRTLYVLEDIEVESNAIRGIDNQIRASVTAGVETELQEQRKYHMNRLWFFGFALTSAKRNDEEEELLELGRKAKEAGLVWE